MLLDYQIQPPWYMLDLDTCHRVYHVYERCILIGWNIMNIPPNLVPVLHLANHSPFCSRPSAGDWHPFILINRHGKNVLPATLSMLGVINASDSKCLCGFLTEAAKLLLKYWIYHVNWSTNGCLVNLWFVYNARRRSHIKAVVCSVTQPGFFHARNYCQGCNLWGRKTQIFAGIPQSHYVLEPLISACL